MTNSKNRSDLPSSEWRRFRTRGRIATLLIAMAITVSVGVLFATQVAGSVCVHDDVEVPCSELPRTGAEQVSDNFFYGHRTLEGDGEMTARIASMTGVITYPPPDHDEIVEGVVPWAKAGIIIKADSSPGSSYAAVMMTGHNGVRMQHDFHTDIAGSATPSGSPRWLKLTRDGDTVAGFESADGSSWTKIGDVVVPDLPPSAHIGLFATSPGDLTVAAGGIQSRFTQVTARFDNIETSGDVSDGWTAESVGAMGNTDWETKHQAPGFTERGGIVEVTGSGDIGPLVGEAHPAERLLYGLILTIAIVAWVAIRFVGTARSTRLAAACGVTVAAGFATGGVAVAVTLLAGGWIYTSGGLDFTGLGAVEATGLVVGCAAITALAAGLAAGLRGLTRRTWVAATATAALLVIPYVVAIWPTTPVAVADGLLLFTPAAGFAAQQTLTEYSQVMFPYDPAQGYYPLPGWAGLAVLAAYTAFAVYFAVRRAPR